MVPTDHDLNRAMALAVGWKWYRIMRCTITSGPEGVPYRILATEEYMKSEPALGLATGDEPVCYNHELSRFCSDRNTLPEILDAVEAAGKQWAMATRLDNELGKGVVASAWIMWRLPMREIVVAALKALGKWNETWDEQGA